MGCKYRKLPGDGGRGLIVQLLFHQPAGGGEFCFPVLALVFELDLVGFVGIFVCIFPDDFGGGGEGLFKGGLCRCGYFNGADHVLGIGAGIDLLPAGGDGR